MQMQEQSFDYWNTLSENERSIYSKLDDFSNLFSDMLFQHGTQSYNLISVQSKLNDGDWFDDEIPLPEQIEYFSYSFFKVEVSLLSDCLGSFNHSTQTLSIDINNINNDSVILHEMIHLHEYVITDELPQFYYDAILWSLYKSLRNYIPSLDDLIDENTHILTTQSIFESGGTHDLLFLLKSFDLDIKMNYPLGTVFGYGRDDTFKNIKYLTQ